MKTSAEIWWSDDDECWIAIDRLRPGCSAVGDTSDEALRELQDARIAWEGAKAAALTSQDRTDTHPTSKENHND